MTDLEMTKLCAAAMGVKVVPSTSVEGGWVTVANENCSDFYDPLRDDAQAMALVKKFELEILPDDLHQFRVRFANRTDSICTQDFDLNRAIVECVARMYERFR